MPALAISTAAKANAGAEIQTMDALHHLTKECAAKGRTPYVNVNDDNGWQISHAGYLESGLNYMIGMLSISTTSTGSYVLTTKF